MARYLMQTLVVLFHMAYGDSSTSPCEFPPYLTNNRSNPDDVWFGRPKLDGDYIIATFNRTLAETFLLSPAAKEKIKQFDIKCMEQYNVGDGTKYKIEMTNITSKQAEYACVEFKNWSQNGNVFQKYAVGPTENEHINCTEEKYRLLSAPMISNLPRDGRYSGCRIPASGYNVKTTLFPNKQQLCVNTLLEAECLLGEGLKFNFKDATCVPPQTGWATDQTLYCLATQSDESERYTFSVLTLPGYKARWCMRLPKNMDASKPFVMEIFLDLTCPTEFNETTTNFIRMELTPAAEAPGAVSADCTFDKEAVTPGNYTHHVQPHVTVSSLISGSRLHIPGVDTFMCSEAVDSHTYMLTSQPKGSCRRRYTCGKFAKAGPMVQLAKLGRGELSNNKFQVCSDANFRDDPIPVRDLIRSRDWKVLIREDEVITPWEGCKDLHAIHYVLGTTRDGSSCNGTLSSCNTASGFHADWTCAPVGDYFCLGALVQNTPLSFQLFTAKHSSNTSDHRLIYDYNCWLHGGGRTYLLPTSQCNVGTLSKINTGWVTPLVSLESVNETEGCINASVLTTLGPGTTSDWSGPNTGTVVGAVLGSLLGLTALCVLGCMIFRHSRLQAYDEPSANLI